MDEEGSDNDGELFVRSAYPPIQLPLDYSLHQKKHRIVARDVKVVAPSAVEVKPDTIDVKPETMDVKPDPLLLDRKTRDTFSTSGDRSPPMLVTTSNTLPTSLSASKVTAAEVFSHLDDSHAAMALFQLPDTLPFTTGSQAKGGGEGTEAEISEEVRPSVGGLASNVMM